MAKVPLDDVALNRKCREFLEQLATDWEDELEAEAKACAMGTASGYDAREIAQNALDVIDDASRLIGRGAWSGERDSEGDPMCFLNHYRCDRCGGEWSDIYSCLVDDDCPECGARHWSPYKTEDVDEYGNVIEEA